jgi:hypothetical protein
MNRVMLWRARFGDSIALEGGPRPDPRYQRTVASAMIFALTIGAAYGATAQNSVQGVPNAMQGFSQNRDQPIQIEAASLEMRDKKKEATLSSNVKAVQGDTTMTSEKLVVFYESGSLNVAAATLASRPLSRSARRCRRRPARPNAPRWSAAATIFWRSTS